MPSLRKASRRTGGLILSATRAVVSVPVTIARFLGSQALGTASNVRGFVGWLSIDRALPPAVASTLKWLGGILPKALGFGSSYEQTAASGVLIIGAISATILTFGLTAAAVAVMVPLFLIGLARFIPAANRTWVAGRRRIPSRDDVSRPKWER